MGNRRTLIAIGAIVLAAVAGLLVFFYASGADNRAADKVDTVRAFVAVNDIPKGTTGDAALADGLIQAEDVLRGSVPPAAVTDSSLLGGKVAAATLQAKQYITDASFVSPAEGGGGSLAAAIGDRSRVAVTVSVDAERGVAGQIAPGDRVDIAVVAANKSGSLYLTLKPISASASSRESSVAASGK